MDVEDRRLTAVEVASAQTARVVGLYCLRYRWVPPVRFDVCNCYIQKIIDINVMIVLPGVELVLDIAVQVDGTAEQTLSGGKDGEVDGTISCANHSYRQIIDLEYYALIGRN